MPANLQLSPRQLILLLVVSRLSTTFTYLPAVNTPPANQDVWIAELLSVLYGFILCGPLLLLSSRFETQTLFQFLAEIMGTFAGKFCSLLYVGLMIFFTVTQLVLLDNFMQSSVMPETPDFSLMAGMLTVGIYAVYKGPVSLGRLAELIGPFIFAIILFLTLLNLPKMEFPVLLPMFSDSSFLDINIGALSAASRDFEIIALAILAPHVSPKGQLIKIFAWYIAICTVFFLIITISVQTILGLDLAVKANFPYYLCTQLIDIFDVIERIEVVNAVAWFLGVFTKCSLFLYLSAVGAAHIFGGTYKYFVIPIAVLALLIVLKTPLLRYDIMSYVFSYKIAPFINLSGMFIIPTFAMLLLFIRKKAQSRAVNETN